MIRYTNELASLDQVKAAAAKAEALAFIERNDFGEPHPLILMVFDEA